MNSVSVQATQESEKSVLIVYLSRTNNTEAVAEIIRDEAGGDMVELELENPYPEDYDAIVAQVDKKMKRVICLL